MTTRPIGTPKTKANPTLVLGMFGLSLVLLGLPLLLPATYSGAIPAQPASAISTSSLSASLNGALTKTSTGTVSCTANSIIFGLASTLLYQTQVVLTTHSLGTDSAHYDLSGSGAQLEVKLLDTNGKVYRSFTATRGTAETSASDGRLSAILYDDNGEQLLLNARWLCAE